MQSSSNPLLRLIFTADLLPEELDTNSAQRDSSGGKKEGRSTLSSPTICTQFKAQLASLIKKIQSTKPHYIRCIKPNDLNAPDSLDRLRTTEQLRYGGVLEAVRVARSGFPVRLSHEDFFARYRILANPFNAPKSLPRYMPRGVKVDEAVNQCSKLLELMWDTSLPSPAENDKMYVKKFRKNADAKFVWGPSIKIDQNTIQLGKSKVFLRKQAHDLFESRRSRCLIVAAKRIQAAVRRFVARRRYQRALKAVDRIQVAIRYFTFHRRFIRKRRLQAAVRLQTSYRRHLHSRKFHHFRVALISLQSGFRRLSSRRKLFSLKLGDLTLRLQSLIRMLLKRRRYRWFLRAVTQIQCNYRIKCAKRELRNLRIAARDVNSLKQSNESLKKEIEKLKAIAAEASVRWQPSSLKPIGDFYLQVAEKERAVASAVKEALEREREEARAAFEREREEAREAEEQSQNVALSEQERLQQLVKEAQLANTDLRVKLDGAQASLEREREEKLLQMNMLVSEKDNALAVVRELQLEIQSLSAARSESSEMVNGLESRTRELNVALESAEIKITTLSKLNEVLELEKSVLEEHNAELRQTSELQAAEIAASRLKIEDLEKALETAMSGAEHIDELSELHEQEKAYLEEKCEKQSAKIKSVEEALVAAEAQTIQLRADIVTLESRNLVLTKKCEVLEASLGIKDAAHADLASKHQVLAQELDKKSAALQENLEGQMSMQSRLQEAENQLQVFRTEKEEAEFKVEELMTHTLELEDAATASAAALAAKSAENQDLKTQLLERDQALVHAKAEVDALALQVAKQEGTIKALEDAMTTFRHEQRDLLEQQADLKAKFAAQQLVMAEKYSALSKSDLEIIELHEANAVLEAKVTHLTEDITELEKTVELLDTQIAEMRSENEKLSTEVILRKGERDADVTAAIAQRDIFKEKLELQSEETTEIVGKLLNLEKDNKELRETKEGLERRLRDLEKKQSDLEFSLKEKDNALAQTTAAKIKERFASNTTEFRQKMKVGILSKVFTVAFPPTDCIITIKEPSLLCFNQSSAGWSLISMFSSGTPDISPISVCDITEIHPGLTPEAIAMFPAIGEKDRATNLFLTVVFKPSMTYVIAVQSADDRSTLLNGLRALIAEIELVLNSVSENIRPVAGDLSFDDSSVVEKNAKLSRQVFFSSNLFSCFDFS